MIIRRFTFSVFVALIAALSLRGQGGRPLGALHQALRAPGSASGNEGYVSQPIGSNKLTWTWISVESTGLVEHSRTHILPFDQPVDIHHLSPGVWWLVGLDTGSGSACIEVLHFDFVGRHIVTLNRQSYPGVRLATSGYDSKNHALYVLDEWSSTIYAFPVPDGANTLLPVAMASLPALSSMILPAIADPSYELWTDRYGMPPLGGGDLDKGVLFVSNQREHRVGTSSKPRFWVAYDPLDGWTFTPHSLRPISNLERQNRYSLRRGAYTPLAGTWQVKGPPGLFDIVDEDSGITAFQGSLNPPSDWWISDDSDPTTWETIQIPNGALEQYRRYRIRSTTSPGITPSRLTLPILRYGVPTQPAGSNQRQLLPGSLDSFGDGGAVIGNAKFAASSRLLLGEAGSGADVSVFLLLAFRNPDGTDPIVDQGDGTFSLQTTSFIGPKSVVGVERESLSDTCFFGVPLPELPSLIGQTLLFQVVASVDGDPLRSDVFGITIHDGSAVTGLSTMSVADPCASFLHGVASDLSDTTPACAELQDLLDGH